MKRTAYSLVGLLALTAGLVGTVGAAETNDLRVSRIVLFSSGVGYFERDATVSDNAGIELKFRTAQINDILKSLIVQDFDGGTIGTVGYASQDPVDKALKSFGVDITGKPTLGLLMDQLRGEPVEIAGPRAMKGIIVGVEKQRVRIDDKNVIEVDMLNVLTDAGIEQLQINTLQGIRLTNEKTNTELRKALATLAASHDADKKGVVIQFNGKGERRVRASYLLESPVWKTSYRLALTADKKPFLQGWAIVENTTEEDWNDVQLSLVSGRPISFAMDLYTPLYVPRPTEQMELYASLRPPQLEAGFVVADAVAATPPMPATPAASAAPAKKGVSLARRERVAESAGRQMSFDAGLAVGGLGNFGVESLATAKEAGELFEYAIQTPVSIARQRSAMLPIVNEAVEGEKLSVFNPATHPKYPLNALLLNNVTKLHLMQGPVTVFDGDVYAGDAKLPDLQPGEKRMVAYAMDLAMEVVPEQKSQPNELVSLRIAKGTLIHKHKYGDERNYLVKNKDGKDRVLVIEQPYSADWTLIEPKEPYERTQNLLRFKVTAPAGKTVSMPVKLERVADEAVMLVEMGLDNIVYYIRTTVISPKVKEALQKVVEIRTEVDRLARERAKLENELKETTTEQARVRENLKTLDRNTDSYKRQMKIFDDQETQIGKLREQIASARKVEEQKKAELQAYLLSLDVE